MTNRNIFKLLGTILATLAAIGALINYFYASTPLGGTLATASAFWLIGMGAFALYFAPSLIANGRQHHNRHSILIVNFVFGWTMIGWIVALVWAVSNPPQVRVAS